MHAIRVHEYGDASRLSYDDIPVPEPQAGEVRVKVAATGLNFVEIYNRKRVVSETLYHSPWAASSPERWTRSARG